MGGVHLARLTAPERPYVFEEHSSALLSIGSRMNAAAWFDSDALAESLVVPLVARRAEQADFIVSQAIREQTDVEQRETLQYELARREPPIVLASNNELLLYAQQAKSLGKLGGQLRARAPGERALRPAFALVGVHKGLPGLAVASVVEAAPAAGNRSCAWPARRGAARVGAETMRSDAGS